MTQQQAQGNVQNMVGGNLQQTQHFYGNVQTVIGVQHVYQGETRAFSDKDIWQMRNTLLQYQNIPKFKLLHSLLCNYAKTNFGTGKIVDLTPSQLAAVCEYHSELCAMATHLAPRLKASLVRSVFYKFINKLKGK